MFSAEDIKNTYNTNDKLNEAVRKNTENAKRCADNGECYCHLDTYGLPYSMRFVILEKLKELGYKEWKHTVYSCGVPQRCLYFTWL